MEAAGLAFGVAGVTGTVTSCITIWEYISTARHTPEDLKYFLSQVYLETFSFFSWCQLTGLWDKVLEAQSGAATADLPAPLKEDLAFSKDVIKDLLHKGLEYNIQTIQANLESAKKLLQDYGVIGEPRKRNRLQKRNPLEEFSETSQIIQAAAVKERQSTAWDKAKWAASGRKESEGIIDKLRASNKGLRTILEMVDHPRARELWRSLQMGASIPILSRAVIESPALQPSAEPLTEQESTLVAIGRLSERERQVRQPGAGWAALEVDAAPYLKESDFNLHEDKTPTLERQMASFQGQVVVVEWRYYSSRLSPDAQELLGARISHLVSQLKQSSCTTGFLVPPCLGFFHSKSHGRYGIVFQTKNGGQAPKTLYDRLIEDHCDKSLVGRDLGARLHLSRQLVISMFRFFTVGWIHKNVRSSSFVFLDPDPERLQLADVYLLGFSRARSDTPGARTEMNPSVLQESHDTRKWRLYCHPDRDPSRTEGAELSRVSLSQMHHDAFGLGIVLLEIALWAPVTKICSSTKSVPDFHRDVLKERMDSIRFHMGARYAEIVRRLLTGDFDMLVNQGKSLEDNRIIFLKAFEKTIVMQMETLFE